MRLVTLALLGALALAPGMAGAGQPAAPTPGAGLDVDAQRVFLETAKVVATRPIGKGITGALRVTLSDGVLTHDAAFQSVAIDPVSDGRRRAGEMRFADHYRFNVAAWRLATLLGLGHMMPVTIERRVAGKLGALSWWVDDVAMDEAAREAKNAQPPDALAFSRQRQRMLVFAELVRDMDRNKGNVVYTSDWRLVMLDFTRAFRIDARLRSGELATCDRSLYTTLQTLTREAVEQAVGTTLSGSEIRGVMRRRDLLVEHFTKLIAERGEARVLY